MGLRESDLRRPEFAGGVPLLLPDGQAWWFYEPKPDAGRPGAWCWGDVAPEDAVALTDTLYAVLDRLTSANDERERATTVLTLALVCLARNYEMDGERLNKIMTSGPITEGLWVRLARLACSIEWAAVDAVLTGGRADG